MGDNEDLTSPRGQGSRQTSLTPHKVLKPSTSVQEKNSTPSRPKLQEQNGGKQSLQLNQANKFTSHRGNRANPDGKGRYYRRPKPHELYKQNQQILELMLNTKDFKKFFVIKPEDDVSMSSIDIIKANKDLERKICEIPKKVSELRSGGLLIEVANESQSIRIQDITFLLTYKVKVEQHTNLNSSKKNNKIRELATFHTNWSLAPISFCTMPPLLTLEAPSGFWYILSH